MGTTSLVLDPDANPRISYQDYTNEDLKYAVGTDFPSIIIYEPNSATSYRQGEQIDIEWRYTRNPGSAVRIELLKGSVVNRVITASTPIGPDGQGYVYLDDSDQSTTWNRL